MSMEFFKKAVKVLEAIVETMGGITSKNNYPYPDTHYRVMGVKYPEFEKKMVRVKKHIRPPVRAGPGIDPSQAEVIKELGFGTSIVFLILAVFLSLTVIVCGFFLLYNVYFRFLKILVIVPFGAIVSSTLAGNRGISNTFVSFMKYFISVVFEAVTMALAILLCNAFISSGLPAFTGDYADWAKTLIYLGEMTFTAALTVGTVKGAQNLTSRALGL